MSAHPERLRAVAWTWVRWAQENLVGARSDAQSQDVARRLAGFRAQQVAELAIKAVLVAQDQDPPKIHDLLRLVALCGPDAARAFDAPGLPLLSELAVAARYPGDVPDFAVEDVIATAEHMLAAAIEQVTRIVGAEASVNLRGGTGSTGGDTRRSTA